MRSVALLFLVAIMASCQQRPICNQLGQPADSNPRNAAGELDPTCPAYGVVATGAPRCTEPPEKSCVYRAMGDCGGASAACDLCADVVCGCSCPGALDGGAADAGCVWTCGR